MSNRNMNAAREAKNDEFYTRLEDIQIEMDAYYNHNPDVFRNKVVYCNCDDPYKSNFFYFFARNFDRLGLKQLIASSYKAASLEDSRKVWFGNRKQLAANPKPVASRFIVNSVDGIEGAGDLKEVVLKLQENKLNDWKALKGNGDFRSPECVALLKKSDIVVSNPPFSLFREYLQQLFDYEKQFSIIGSFNAIMYIVVFSKFMEKKLWLGASTHRLFFYVPDSYKINHSDWRIDPNGGRLASIYATWFTNMPPGRSCPEPLSLMTMEENLRNSKHSCIKGKESYDKYDNFDVLEVPFVDAIPSDYTEVMGVPFTFLEKYNSDQFEIVGASIDTSLMTKHYPRQTRITGEGKRSVSNCMSGSASILLPGPPKDVTYYVVDHKCYILKYDRLFIKHRNPHQASST